MNQRDYYNIVFEAMANWPSRISILCMGSPGTGKTQIPQQVIRDNPDWDLRIINIANQEQVDVKGVPITTKDQNGNDCVVWLPMAEMAFLLKEPEKPTLVLLEELPQADHSVQKAWGGLLERNTRGLDGNRISDKYVFVATGNRRQDRAGSQGILHHIESRFTVTLELEAEIDPYLEWAEGCDPDADEPRISPLITSYLRYKPGNLVVENPNMTGEWAVSPRAWDNVNLVLTRMTGLTKTVKNAIITRKLGEDVAKDFLRHWTVITKLPGPSEILSNVEGCPLPSGPSETWILVEAIAHWTTPEQLPSFARYVERICAAQGSQEWGKKLVTEIIREGKAETQISQQLLDLEAKYREDKS